MKTRSIVALTSCLAAAVVTTHGLRNHGVGDIWGQAAAFVPAREVPAIIRSLHPNYPYSVISGGVYSAAELEDRQQKDPVVRAHYAGFETKAAQLVTSTADQYRYVSYRAKDRIYWTKTKLRIPRGELLLTDGRNLCRSRCGNRLSNTPQPNTSPLQPTAELSLPSLEAAPGHSFPLSFAAPLGPSAPAPVTLDTRGPIAPFSSLTPPGAEAPWGVGPQVPGSTLALGAPPQISPAAARSPGATGQPPTGPPGSPPLGLAEIPEPSTRTLFSLALLALCYVLVRLRTNNP
ncbi:MAG: hypothetical protein JOZ62_12100 [Acidobacteriaceae bacterium]|nr:hypothetical protein [Acidobacteriaceae bacterium]